MKEIIPWRKRRNGGEFSVSRRDPVDLLHRRVNALFDDFFEDFGSFLPASWLSQSEESFLASPNFEVSETGDEFRIKAELPGMDEKDIEVSLEGDLLTVRGEKKREREEKHRSYHVAEVTYGSFSRSMRLPDGIDLDHAKAQFKRGVLTLTIPKKEEVKANRRKLEIEVD